MAERESVFVCTFRTAGGESRVYVRAWTAQQALESLREELAQEGVTDADSFHVASRPGGLRADAARARAEHPRRAAS